MVLEGVKGGGGYYSGLPHPAAERLSDTSSLPDSLLIRSEQGAHGRAEALGGADGGRVGMLAPLARGGAGRNRGVEDPRPVEMHLKAEGARLGGYGGEAI